ncbi:uncharacterized protein BJ212DRAFT_1354694 [Suillus subaureus]|uniref:F-box domain-containing protein n=1 Tax=Suillus subaureus TaxID=48587 RepID=A0A9P7JDK0_9AGAM|nr:uncharacterized protein BJ212DRAFT_1354694 [Suillus subaureus]KAG1816415.1 hypothetical protein BJ212DRAFT_1354694 [Suillus subaureus]
MHPCLLVSEILVNIFAEVNERDEEEAARTLAALCRTCRAFREPAMKVLWAHLGTLVPLIRCIPCVKTIRSKGKSQDDLPTLALEREMTSTDWEIFLSHSRLVLTCGYYVSRRDKHPVLNSPSHDIGTDILRALSSPPPSSTVFPHLRKIRWTDSRKDSIRFFRLILTPALEFLDMSSITDSVYSVIIPSINDACPSLRIMHLPKWPFLHLPDMFDKWPNLAYVTSGPLADATIQSLGRLTHLASMDICLHKLHDIKSLVENPGFSTLRRLVLRAYNINLVTAFMRQVKSVHLREVKCYLPHGTTAVGIQEWITILLDRCMPRRLEILEIEDYADAGAEFPDQFTLTPDYASALLAICWPSMQSIALGTHWGWRQQSDVSLKGLLSLVRHCPQLESIGLVMNAVTTDITCQRPGGGLRRPKVTSLNVGDSRVGDPLAVAAFLSDVFPRLLSVDAFNHLGGRRRPIPVAKEHEEKWKEVERLLPAFSKVRAQEHPPVGPRRKAFFLEELYLA